MATAAQPALKCLAQKLRRHAAQTQQPRSPSANPASRPPQKNELRITISKRLFCTLREMLDLASSGAGADQSMKTVETFACELLANAAADFRLLRIPNNFLFDPRDKKGRAPETPTRLDVHQRVLQPEVIQQVLFVSERENLTQRELAARFRCSASTIRRILLAREQSTEIPAPGRAHRGGAPIPFSLVRHT